MASTDSSPGLAAALSLMQVAAGSGSVADRQLEVGAPAGGGDICSYILCYKSVTLLLVSHKSPKQTDFQMQHDFHFTGI